MEIFEELNDVQFSGETGTVLETRNLTKSFGGFFALNGFSLSVNAGDIYGLVGENGSGKTTFMRTVCGLMRPDGGEYLFFGKTPEDPEFKKLKKKIGAVIETPHAFLNMSARDNLIAQCMLYGISNPDIDGILSTVGLESERYSKKKVVNYSLGMRQRLGIALALVTNPAFVMLDEPMNGLDPLGIIEVRNLILDLNRKGVTFLVSSHILSELGKVATRYGFVKNGRIVKEITAAEVNGEDIESIYVSAMSGGARW